MGVWKDISSSGISWIFSSLLSITLTTIIARVLGPEEKGLYVMINLWTAISIFILELGLGNATVFFLGNRKNIEKKIVVILFSYSLIIFSLCLILFSLSRLFENFYLPKNFIPQPIFYLVLMLVPFNLVVFYIGRFFVAKHEFKLYYILGIVSIIAQLLGLLVLIKFPIIPLHLFVPFLITFGLATQFLISLQFLVDSSSFPLSSYDFDFQLLKELFRYGLFSYVAVMFTYLNLRVDQLMIPLLLDLRQLGLYSVAVTGVELITKFSTIANLVVFSYTASEEKRINNITPMICRISMLLSSLVSIFLISFGSFFINVIFGDQFKDALFPLLIMLPGAIVCSVTQVLSADLFGRGDLKTCAYANALGVIVSVLGNFLLTSQWGIKGAAAISDVAYFLVFFCVLHRYLLTTKLSISNLLIPNRTDIIALRRKIFKESQI
jgi:O-antigen/teichoic acid export membrane protein